LAEQEAGASYATVLARTAGHTQRSTPKRRVELDPGFTFSKYPNPESRAEKHQTNQLSDSLGPPVTATEQLTNDLPPGFGSVTQPGGQQNMQSQTASSLTLSHKNQQASMEATAATSPLEESRRLTASVISSSVHSYSPVSSSDGESGQSNSSMDHEEMEDFTLVTSQSRRGRSAGRGGGGGTRPPSTKLPLPKALDKKKTFGTFGSASGRVSKSALTPKEAALLKKK
jgi:hypothetical protein